MITPQHTHPHTHQYIISNRMCFIKEIKIQRDIHKKTLRKPREPDYIANGLDIPVLVVFLISSTINRVNRGQNY